MAIKVFQHFLCICLFSLALPQPSHASQSKPKAKNPTSFDFIKHLEGGRKGQTVKGLQHLKTYLQEFGYINYSPNQTGANDDDFDDSMEAAVKTYQLNYHLKTSGTLDAQTVSQMMAPRCGFPDISNGTNWMRASKNEASHTQNTIHTVSHFTFFPSKPRWPPSRYRLTYGFAPGTRADAKSAVARAFNIWASQSPFTFAQIQDLASADLKIGFYRGDHGDGAPFSPNSVVAHAFAPTNGRFHYNEDFSFSENPVAGSFHLEIVALHEIGHLLGLGHSAVQEAIMYPSVPAATIKGLHADDIQGIKTLYDLEPVGTSSFVVFQCDV